MTASLAGRALAESSRREDFLRGLIASLSPASGAHAGSGSDRLVADLGSDIRAIDEKDLAKAQLDQRFDLLVLTSGQQAFDDRDDRHLILHNVAVHLLPGGWFLSAPEPGTVGDTDEVDELALRCGLALQERWPAHDAALYRRTERTTVHDLMYEARSGLTRLSAAELHALLDAADPSLVVLDTRTPTDRRRHGVIAGSIHAPRTVLEWMADPASGYSHPAVVSFDQRLVVVCGGGYSSSLAAANLQRLGFRAATDLVGGIEAWARAGLPLVPPDHEHREPGTTRHRSTFSPPRDPNGPTPC